MHDLPALLHRRLLPELRVVVTVSPEQLDLFAPATETRRLVDGLTCLRDAVPEALETVIHLADWRPIEAHGIAWSSEWAYTIRRAGLRYERRRDWDGGTARLRCITWPELGDLVADDPRRPGLIAWAESLTAPDSWKDLHRPFELWPHPDRWHPGYIEGDHQRPGWLQRIAAWRNLLAILTDAITRLDAEVPQ